MSKQLRAQQEALEALWKQGLSGHELLIRHTSLVDEFIREQFEQPSVVHDASNAVAVVALGGYGRRELYPFSDIDLLLLYDRRSKKSIQAIAEALLYPLWDAGFEVGHSVRSIKDAVRFAREDYIFQVSLLDARLLAGSQALCDGLKAQYKKKIFDGKRHVFVRTMEEFREERRQKFGSHSYLLEPHIKEGKGGMRDIQSMLWVAKGVFGLEDLEAMQAAGMLAKEDRLSFQASWNMLARIRNRLHYIRRRKNDQLIFEFQEEIAAALDYSERDGVLPVEQFMRDVYRHLQNIAVVTDLFFEQVHEVLGMIEASKSDARLEGAIILRNGTIRLLQPGDIEERSYLLMRLFLQSGRTGKPLHHRTRQLVARNLELLDDGFRSSKRVARIFLELLTHSDAPFPVLEVMLETGLLTGYIPEFLGVESLAQHDLYHVYTVDRHQLQAVAELTLLKESHGDIFAEMEDQHVLYLAALLHDIGKGKKADHSELGAGMVDGIGRRLRLTEAERRLLAFLVRYHLYLPENALRRDLDDQEFIQQAAELIGDTQRLNMLYLLTIADSKATGPSAWSGWKATLLGDLYLKVKSCLEAECHITSADIEGEENGVAWLRQLVETIVAGQEPPRIAIDKLPPDYLLSFTPEVVAYHLQLHREQAGRLQQQVLLFPTARHDSWSLLIMTRDRAGLLAKLCGVLALHNLSVLAAQIFTWPDDTVVDMLDVYSATGSEFDEQDWLSLQSDMNLAVNYRLDVGLQLKSKAQPLGLAPRRKVQQLERKVVIDNESVQKYTIIEVYGGDSPSTLYQLTQSLADFGLVIHRAKIATEVEQLIDVFYVRSARGEKLNDPVLTEKVNTTLLHIIGEDDHLVNAAA